MAITPLQYDDIVDIRFDPFANAGTGEFNPLLIGYASNPAETRLIPASAPYVIKLYEAPLQSVPSTTTVELVSTSEVLTEVSQVVTPADKQYRVVYYNNLGLGQIQFHKNQAGLEVDISYYGLGHGIQKISLDTRVPDSGDTNIGGIKTFTNTTDSSSKDTGAIVTEGGIGIEKNISAGGLLDVLGGFEMDYRNSAGIESRKTLKPKLIEIGDWNMDTTSSVQFAHGLSNYKKVRGMMAIIRSDDDNTYIATPAVDPANTIDLGFASTLRSIDATRIYISRRTGGYYDNVNYNSTSYNRGWVFLWYEV